MRKSLQYGTGLLRATFQGYLQQSINVQFQHCLSQRLRLVPHSFIQGRLALASPGRGSFHIQVLVECPVNEQIPRLCDLQGPAAKLEPVFGPQMLYP